MKIGCYYRCPIPIEEDDDPPRFFVLAQVVEYHELADAVRVKMHDLLGSGVYYGDLFRKNVFKAKVLTRCEAVPGGVVEGIWGRGTVVSRIKKGHTKDEPYWYWVKLPNGKYVKACETELRIEYSQMNYSPKNQLRSYEFQNPAWFMNRLKVSKNLHLVKNATYGFETLAGCRAFLMPHQISTVVRCFETMPIRYMLADEVGLGKTVEACSILKILMSENRRFKTLIIAPAALISQWKSELHYKFGLEASSAPMKTAICLLALEDVLAKPTIVYSPWDLVIVDETHRLLGQDVLYRSIQALSRRVQHILLLSATPIQDRNDEYRRLLALLSPEQYENMPSDRFASMVEKQQRIQDIVNQQLNRLERYDTFKEVILEKLQGVVDTLNDKALNKMVSQISLDSADQGLEQVRRAFAYICENYRVERRVIRNRRQLLNERMAERTLVELPYKPLSMDENYNEIGAIQDTLAFLGEYGEESESYISSTAIPLLSALFSSPWAFDSMLQEKHIKNSLLQERASTWKVQARNEHLVAQTALEGERNLIRGRLMTALDYLVNETQLLDSEDYKVVVFTAFNDTLLQFQALVTSYFKSKGIRPVAFGKHMSREALEDSVYAFQNDPSCRIIICDETGGEGRNFQNASMIMHLDTPWNANDLEQRIGRLDRLGRDPEREVLSAVVFAENTIEEQLFHIWRDGMKLYEQSLSGLEIVTGELNSLIVKALLDDYRTGLINAFDDIVDQADEMRESVEDEQDFDLGATLYRPMTEGIETVLELYASENDALFANAMMGWGCMVGLHQGANPPTGLIEFRDSNFGVNSAKQSLFIPPDWSTYANASIVRREGKILGSFDRKTAALREDVLFFAPGDPLYDAIITNAVGCSRGRCTAIATKSNYVYDGLIYIYKVEPSVDSLLENGIGLETLDQYKMYLPLEQIMITMPLNADSRKIPEQTVLDTLLNLRTQNADHMGQRSGTRFTRSPLERFISQFPPNLWEPLVDKFSNDAYKKACERMVEQADLKAASREMNRILNGYRAECLFFDRSQEIVQQKETIFNATLDALKTSKPVLDSVCYLRVRMNG